MPYMLPRDYLSASQVNKYLSCPQQYYRDYILDEKPEFVRPSVMSVGSAVHKLVENKITSVIDNREIDERELFLTTDLAPFFENTDLEEQDPEYWYTTSQILYQTWYKELGMSIMPIGSEKKIESLVGDVPVLGYIDYIDVSAGSPEIVDLKVTKRAKSLSDARDSVQLAMYAITQENPRVRFDSVVRTKKPKVAVTRYEFAPWELQYYTDLIGEVATNITAGNFPMSSPTSWSCSQTACIHFDMCRGKYAER